jgi:hypothetical protein
MLETLEVRRVPAALAGLDTLTPPPLLVPSAADAGLHHALSANLDVSDAAQQIVAPDAANNAAEVRGSARANRDRGADDGNFIINAAAKDSSGTAVAKDRSDHGNHYGNDRIADNVNANIDVGDSMAGPSSVQIDETVTVHEGPSRSAELHADGNARFNRDQGSSGSGDVTSNGSAGIGGNGGSLTGGGDVIVSTNNANIIVEAVGQVTIQIREESAFSGVGNVQANIGAPSALIFANIGAEASNLNGSGTNGSSGGSTRAGVPSPAAADTLNAGQTSAISTTLDSGDSHAGNVTDSQADDNNLLNFFLPLDLANQPDNALRALVLSQIPLLGLSAPHGAPTTDANSDHAAAVGVVAADDSAGGAGAAVAGDAAAPGTQEADLVMQFQPVDPAALAVIMQQYLDQVSSLGDGLAGMLSTLGPSAWMMAAAITITAYELVRHRQRRGQSAQHTEDTVPGLMPPELAAA